MAGEGIKLFLSGDILTASDLNGYLMDQVVSVFDNAADRDAAFGTGTPISLAGDGKPALAAGRLCFLLDDGTGNRTIQYYDGSNWQDSDQFVVADGGITEAKLASNSVTSAKIVDGTIVNADINASAGIVDTKLATITTADKVSLGALNIDGATDIGAAIADVDLFVVDDGGAGTNRKAAATRITDYVFSKVSGDITITSGGVASITNEVTNLDDLGDVSASTPSTGQALLWSGSVWQNETIPLSPPDDDQPVLAARIFR
jgi:hypothetical protein